MLRSETGSPTYINRDTARYAVIREPWKLILYTTDILAADAFNNSRLELYNLELDLQEKNNLTSQKPEMVKKMFTSLIEFHKLQENPVELPSVGKEGFVAPRDWVITNE